MEQTIAKNTMEEMGMNSDFHVHNGREWKSREKRHLPLQLPSCDVEDEERKLPNLKNVFHFSHVKDFSFFHQIEN